MQALPHRRRLAAALAALSPAAGDDAADTATLLAEEIVLPDGETLTVRAAEPRDALTLDTVMAYGFASDMDAMVSPCQPALTPELHDTAGLWRRWPDTASLLVRLIGTHAARDA